ncbi:MAG TPA: PBP1A family penicillin-binding protein [Vicinamibacterales bacterium]|jgi:penicillin-binding protein 1A
MHFAHLVRRAGVVLLFVVAAVLGITTGILFAYAGDLPAISALDNYAPSTISRVYGARGDIVGEFAIERREIIPYEKISPRLEQAILAAEDDEFYQHAGLSMSRIVVTAINDIIHRRMHGASTLTQQLARKLFLTDDKTPERKIKEAILAIQIEKRYTKREIFTMYCNQMYFGHGVYGVEAAARLYFGKAAKDVSIEEAAMIAGILQGNVRQSPYVNMEAALRRRNYTLGRMAEVGFITQADAEEAKKKAISVRGDSPQQSTSIAPYFLEEVRRELESRYGAKQLYENGLSIQTALDVRLQDAANRALDEGLRRIDKRRGFRKPRRNVVSEGHAIDKFRTPRWERAMTPGQIVPAIVTSVDAAAIQLRVGAMRITVDRKGYSWTGKTAPSQLVTRGDLVETRLLTIADGHATATGTLEQPPEVEGSILAIDNRTGQVLAMAGGFSFERSKFNRATQAYRQVGSSFKPFVYTAAIDSGYTPATQLMDTPVSFPGGTGQPAYAPLNYDRNFEGPITLRRALEQSRNVPAVRVMDQLGPTQVIAYARRLGLESPLPPYLAVALGAAEATLMEMTSAYSVYPNQGVRMRPYSVLRVSDREGNVLEENRPEPKDAIRADTAYVMTSLLRGVVQRGTATKAAALNWPIGGKTGTTDDYTDAWFIGFDPDITIGVWTGYDQKRSMGPAGTGSESALPIWIDVMKAWIEKSGKRTEPPQFEAPGNIVFVTVDRGSGNPALEGTPGAITESFIVGTQPGSGFHQ